jgi:hypothetical protein
MAAPAYIEIPLRTNNSGAGTAETFRADVTELTAPWCLTTEKVTLRVFVSCIAGSRYGIRGKST